MAIIYKVLSAMDVEVQRQEAIARNLAGAPIPGYKGESVISSDFDGYLNQFSDSGQGTVYEKHSIDYSAGALKHTGRVLDFAIAGEGFFEVTNTKGEVFYTRNGRFALSPSGELVTSEGFNVSGQNGFIQFGNEEDLNNMRVAENGRITIGSKEIGSLKVVKMADMNNLQRLSSSYFKMKQGHEGEVASLDSGEVKVLGRSLEESNISIVKEMISMIDCMRKFEMTAKVLKMSDGLRSKEQSTFA